VLYTVIPLESSQRETVSIWFAHAILHPFIRLCPNTLKRTVAIAALARRRLVEANADLSAFGGSRPAGLRGASSAHIQVLKDIPEKAPTTLRALSGIKKM